MKPWTHRLTIARAIPAGIAVLFTIAACAHSIRTANMEFVYYSIWMVVFVLGIWWLDVKAGVPTVLLWGLTAWTVAHLLGGTLRVPPSWLEPGAPNTLYNVRLQPWLPKYDQVVHCLGFMTATLTAWVGLRASYPAPPRISLGVGIAIFLMGMGLGAMNEVIEFIATVIMPDTNVGGYVNTGWDLVSNMTGCLIAVTIIIARERRQARA